MHIQVNGDPRDVREAITVQNLLQDLQLNVAQVAVEINREILDKQDVETRRLREGDRVEIMSFIGGGAPWECQDLAGGGHRCAWMEKDHE